MHLIDLRSDTVSHPTPAMRRAMSLAEVGDDVFGDDPSVNRLQAMAAERLGKEAGLFVASGTMGNLIAILAHCGRGDEAILGNKAHTFLYEAGGISALGGVHSCQVANQPDGSLDLEEVRAAIRQDNVHLPPTRLISLENTHNRCGGVALSTAYTRRAGDLAHEHGLVLHLDGARIFNAAAALGVSVAELAAPADSVTFCLSKGLCAPVGSVLCGSQGFIQRAHRLRKMVGGGMRQAGILAAAGIVALETMTERLTQDHHRAKQLAEGLAAIPGIALDPGSPHTNMIFCNLQEGQMPDAAALVAHCKKEGILIAPTGPRRLRLVTHYWIDDRAVERTITAFKNLGTLP